MGRQCPHPNLQISVTNCASAKNSSSATRSERSVMKWYVFSHFEGNITILRPKFFSQFLTQDYWYLSFYCVHDDTTSTSSTDRNSNNGKENPHHPPPPFFTTFLTKRHYNHVLCKIKRISELLLQTKTKRPQD